MVCVVDCHLSFSLMCCWPGNYDLIQQPTNITKAAKKNVCFYMFVDGDTKTYLKNSSMLDGTNRVGLWRVVVVHNLRYADARRNGKVSPFFTWYGLMYFLG